MSDHSNHAAPSPHPSTRWLPYAGLSLLTLLIYAPTFFYGFVWDDFDFVIENYRMQGLSLAHWKAMWLYPSSGLYSPIHHLLLALLYQLGGLDPFVYHAAQVALHAACVCLLFTALRRIESDAVAVIAAALFAVHPANIENAAWITETKSTLAFLFFLVSFLFFLRHGQTGRRREAALCVALFALSLLSKASTVVAPPLLLLFAWAWEKKQHGGLTRSRAALIGVLFACAVAQTLLTLSFQADLSKLAAPDRLTDVTLLAPGATHLENSGGFYGGRAIHLLNLPGFLFHYLKTIAWPARLSIMQMFPVETGWSARAVLLWFALLITLAGIARAWFSRRGRSAAFWMLWFLAFLAPVLQLVPNPIWVADRYLYIPAIGLFVLFARLLTAVAARAGEQTTRRAVLAVPAIAVLALAWATTRHLPIWRSDVSLWSGAMSTCEGSAYCHDMFSLALRREAREAGGEEQVRLRQAAVQEALRAVTIRPTPQKFIFLGDALLDAGDPRALAAYMKTREIMGAIPTVYWTLIAKAHYRFGNLAEAARIIGTLMPASAEDPTVLMTEAFIHWKQGQLAAARANIQKIMSMNTLYPQGPERTLNFVSHYWDDRAEAAQMLREVAAQ